jgi:3-hydroxybutyryl-CoA dehydrogenase
MSGIQKVGIIGAGQMGSGIAHVCALSGMDVVLQDLSMDKVEEGLATISGNMTRQASKDIIKEARSNRRLPAFQASDSYENMADCDLVIESATEDETIKRKILSQIWPRGASDTFSPPTHPRFPSPALPPRPTGRKSSSASIS